jgi:hypothetical protein
MSGEVVTDDTQMITRRYFASRHGWWKRLLYYQEPCVGAKLELDEAT